MRIVVAAALGAVLMGGVARAADFDETTTCGEVMRVVASDDAEDHAMGNLWINAVLARLEMYHISKGEKPLFPSLSEEQKKAMFGAVSMNCSMHQSMPARMEIVMSYEDARRDWLLVNTKPASSKRRRS